MNVLHSTTKKHILNTGVLATLVCALAFGGFQTVSAQDEPSAGAPKPTLRKDAAADRKEIRATAQTERKDIRAIATSTRRTIMQAGKDAAKNIREEAKDGLMNRASTTKALRDNRASTTEALKGNRASTTEAMKANREAMLKEIKVRQDALKKQIEAKKGEKKQKLDDQKKAVVAGALQNIFKKLIEKTAKLAVIDGRLNAKVTELRIKGTDVTTEASLLVDAKALLEKAQVDVEATRTLASQQAATSTSKEILKSLVNTAQASIKTAADAYKKVGENLKPYLELQENETAAVENKITATSTSN